MQHNQPNVFYHPRAFGAHNGAERTASSGAAALGGFPLDSAYLRGCAEVGQELVRFATMRANRAAEAARTLTYCKFPTDVLSAWVDIWRTAAQDFAGEAERLTEVCVRVAAEMHNELATSLEAASPSATPGGPDAAR